LSGFVCYDFQVRLPPVSESNRASHCVSVGVAVLTRRAEILAIRQSSKCRLYVEHLTRVQMGRNHMVSAQRSPVSVHFSARNRHIRTRSFVITPPSKMIRQATAVAGSRVTFRPSLSKRFMK